MTMETEGRGSILLQKMTLALRKVKAKVRLIGVTYHERLVGGGALRKLEKNIKMH
jgi:hypothetical protein